MVNKIFWVLLIFFCYSCSPINDSPVDKNTIILLEQFSAVEDWQKTLKETDECSSTYGLRWFAEYFLDKNWEDCCIQHDFDYREGYKYKITKEQADYELWQCVDVSGHSIVANFIYSSVNVFGFIYYVEEN